MAAPPYTDKIAEGGQGSIYRAQPNPSQAPVAIKVFSPAGARAAQRELDALERLDMGHPFVTRWLARGNSENTGPSLALSFEFSQLGDAFRCACAAGCCGEH